MAFDSESLGLSSIGIALLSELIHQRTGLFYEEGRRDMMADRLAGLVTERGFASFLDYYYFLKYDTEPASEEWGRVMDALSVQETYFWREIDQLKAIARMVVPELAARAPGRPIRIWCVPCATGEEPLTVAMLLDQDSWFERADIELHASDASPAALARARRGVYRERSFRSLPPDLRDRYFERRDDGWHVMPGLHARVRSWSLVNLVDPAEVAPRAAADIVLCRNVFIYFAPATVRDVVAVFAKRMPVPGYLCVGAAESLLRVTDDFELEDVAGAFIYVKRHEPAKEQAV